jgi:transcriptional regulator with XRE-family HTH domain
MDLQVRFGRRLAQFREARGMSQLQLSKKVGVTSQYLGRLEAGERAPSFSVVGAFARALEVDPSLLFSPLGESAIGSATPRLAVSQLEGAASRLSEEDLTLVLGLARRLGGPLPKTKSKIR